MKKVLSSFITLLAILSSTSAVAEFNMEKVYVGGGLAYNSPDSNGFDSAIGFQGFAGYNMDEVVEISDEIGFSVEVGYAKSGDFELSNNNCGGFFAAVCSNVGFSSDGLWSTAVFDYGINDKIKAISRLGYDFADADGLLFGAGAQYALNDKMAVVGEFVIRKAHKGVQANFIYYLSQ